MTLGYRNNPPVDNLWWLLIVVAPLIVLLGIHFINGKFFSDGSNDGWLGFWGGYLGALLGLYGIKIQIKSEQISKVKNARPAWYLYYRRALVSMEKIYVNGIQPKNFNGLIEKSFDTLKFESKYYYDDQNFVAINDTNQKVAFNVKILVESVVRDGKIKTALNRANVGGKMDAKEQTSFLNNISNWSTVCEGIQVPRIDLSGAEMLIVTYAQYHDYDNYITKVSMFYQTELGEEILATFESNLEKNIPQLDNVPHMNYHENAQQMREYNSKLVLFKSVYQNTTSFVVDAVGKEKFDIKKVHEERVDKQEKVDKE